jgi:hypothetical protein
MATVVGGAGLIVAWFVPQVAVITVWPLLYLLPGAILVSWLRPPLTGSARLGLAVIGSVVLTTHLVWWLSTALGGYHRETVFLAAALLALFLPVAAWRRGSANPLAGWLPGAIRALRRETAVIALATTVTVVVGVVLGVSLWRVIPGGVASGGSNWSDLSVHLAIAQSVNAGNFPPDVPYYAGFPLVYHWFGDFHAAIAARAADQFAIPSFVMGSAVMGGTLTLLVVGLARTAFGHGRQARRAAWLTGVLAVLGGGMGWIRLVGDATSGQGTLLELIAAHGYDNQWLTEWPFFFIPSVLGTGLLVHRATAYGLPLAIAAILLLVCAFPRARSSGPPPERRALLVTAGLAGALLAPFQFFFFPAVPLLFAAWLLTSGRGLPSIARAAGYLAVPYLLAIPFVLPALGNALGSGALKLVVGWEMAPFKDGPLSVLFFYLTNLGIPFVLAVAALVVGRPPWRAFLTAWFLGLFALPNLIQLSGISFDMNKYFQLMWIAVAILGASLLVRWPRPLVAGLLAVSLLSPLLAAAWTATSAYGVLGDDELAAADWIAAETPERSVFVTDGWLHAATDPAGRLRLLTFTPYIGNLGYDPSERSAAVNEIFCGGDSARSADLMRRYGAAYVIAGGRPSPCDRPVDFATAAGFEEVFSRGAIRIFHLSSSP